MEFSCWKPLEIPTVLSSDLRPTGSREGVHLSNVLDHMAQAMGEKYGDEDPTYRFLSGFVWETAVEYMLGGMTHDEAMDAAFRRYMVAGLRKDLVTQVHLEKDGLRATPDGFHAGDGFIESYKSTHKKMPSSAAEFEEKFWRWVAAEASYCHILGVDTCRFIVLWNRGNYADIRGPVVMEATCTWTAEELAETWKVILAHKLTLDNKGSTA